MTSSKADLDSPIVRVYQELRRLHPNWYVEFGARSGDGWIPGFAFLEPSEGLFLDLLRGIGARLRSDDRKVVAASFVLRFGWASGVAIAPFLLHRCVPDVRLENVSLRFSDETFFERAALHEPRGVIVRREGFAHHPDLEIIETDPDDQGQAADNTELVSRLRAILLSQAKPVIDALYVWSGFSRRGLWGQVMSSWGAQFTTIFAHLKRHTDALPCAREFFDPACFPKGMTPSFYMVEHAGLKRIYHRRSSCCLYYRVPAGSYCASCPLVSQNERVRRNKEWIESGMAI